MTQIPVIWMDATGAGGFPHAGEPGDLYRDKDGNTYRLTAEMEWVSLGARE